MMEGWGGREYQNGRRLVCFVREQSLSRVTINIQKHESCNGHEEKPYVVISCIQLPDRDGFWVTSFDIVRLAEYILDIPLNTDMKNRARRNMASVDYTTLPRIARQAGKKDSFYTVMDFGEPKPRSIEKSLKVYKWNVLHVCLSKILYRFVCLARFFLVRIDLTTRV